jgi:competence protein ComEC
MKKIWLVLGILVCFNVLAWLGVAQINKPYLEVNFFDVGQGDSILIETPQNQQILIDGGPDTVVLEKLGKEMPFWDRTLDLVVLTHPHSDHINGLLEVLKRYKVENILWTGMACDSAQCQEWRKLVEEEGANVFIARAGEDIKGSSTLLSVLYPFTSLEGQTVADINDASVIMRLVYDGNSFLLTGDASQIIEQKMINGGAMIDSDVLKAGHHGSKNATSPEFLEAVSPGLAVISAGQDNKYGHPHQETLAILEKYGIRTLRTDINNDIKIICNSQSSKQR